MTQLETVRELFGSLQGNVYFQPIHGNLGDELIVMGIHQLAKECELNFTDNANEADHLLVKGGGALLDVYPKLLADFRLFFRNHADTPTTLLPTSYLLNSTDMAEIVGKRSAPLHIFAREKYSYDLLSNIQFDGPVTIGLDHDTAFHLENSDFISELKSGRTSEHVLIVERIDPEALSNATAFDRKGQLARSIKSSIKSVIPRAVIDQLAPLRQKPRPDPTQTPFVKAAHERVLADYPEVQDLPVVAFDVSHEKCCDSLAEFAKVISKSAVVYSSRLHVGILSAMLGIPTYLVEGVYHKIRGIREYSMSDMDHVVMIPSR